MKTILYYMQKKRMILVIFCVMQSATLLAALRQVWHNNAWHFLTYDEYGRHIGYYVKGYKYVKDNVFIPLNPTDLVASKHKQQQPWNSEELRPAEVWTGREWYPLSENERGIKGYYDLPRCSGCVEFCPIDPDKLAQSNEKLPQHRLVQQAEYEANRRVWHNGAWHIFEWVDKAAAQGRKDVPVLYDLVVKAYKKDGTLIILTQEDLDASDYKKKLLHNNAWHNAIWKDGEMRSYATSDDTIITLTDEERAYSDAQKPLKYSNMSYARIT